MKRLDEPRNMDSAITLNSKEIAAIFEISRPTVSRWITQGCPHQTIGNRNYFNLKNVKTWLHINSDPESGLRLKTSRILKRYHVFTRNGYFQTIIHGSKKLIEILNAMEPRDQYSVFTHHYPYGVDDLGYVYFFYSGKLRKHESVKTMACVILRSRYTEDLEPLMEIVRNRYLCRKHFTRL
ncbi:helix-turn-helix domain-containing protein [bacterium]|nr:helix-turn-helix domain-containing protein [bacterium]